MPTHTQHPPQPDIDPPQDGPRPIYQSVQMIAKKWECSEDKVLRVLEKYRGCAGFMDLGSEGSRYRRKKSMLRIHPNLLIEIESREAKLRKARW
jgi:hypothetical protein